MNDFFKKNSTMIVLGSFIIFSVSSMWIGGKTSITSPKDIGMAIFSFFQSTTNSIGYFFGNTINSVQQLSALRGDYDKVVEKLQVYEQRQSDLDLLQAENQRLKQVLQFSYSLAYRNIPAQIIGKDPGIIFDTITINKGYNNGIKKGMPVIGIQNGRQGLVGKVQFVGPESSQILPIFDAQNFVAGRIENNRFEGLINGTGSSYSDLTMTYLAQEAKNILAVGDLVTTSGLNSIYPPNILIGTVTNIDTKSYESSITIKVRPYIEFSRLEYIFLIDTVSRVTQ